MTAFVVECSCANGRRAQVFGFGPEITDEGVSSETQPQIRRCRGDVRFVFSRLGTVESVTNVVDIDDSESEAADPTSAASKRIVDIKSEGAEAVSNAFGLAQVGGRTVAGGNRLDSVWDIRGCV